MVNIENFPVMKGMCLTCPFRHEHEGQIEIADMVRERCMTEASQICHHPWLHNKNEDHLCRGARDFQLQVFHGMGVIEAATDEAWSKKREELAI